MRRSNADLAEEVAALDDFSRERLDALWAKAHCHPAPKGIRHELLVRSASWHLQSNRVGGLSPATKRMLKTAMAEAEAGLLAGKSRRSGDTVPRTPSPLGSGEAITITATHASLPARSRKHLSPGARLVRDWNGKTYIVDVIEEGFVFQAKVHKSLTAIAHQITGAHWSGPRFFGL